MTDALGAREAIGGGVGRKIRQVRRRLRALLQLKGIATKDDVGGVLASAGGVYGVDVTPLATPRETPEAAHEALHELLAAAIVDVQSMETGPQPP